MRRRCSVEQRQTKTVSVLSLATFVAEGHRSFSRQLKSSMMDEAPGSLKVTRAQTVSGC